MGFFDNLFTRKRQSSAQVAHQRLLTVLVNDRIKLTPEMIEQLKGELSDVISRYVPSIDPREIEVSLLHSETSDHLKAEVPLRRYRITNQ